MAIITIYDLLARTINKGDYDPVKMLTMLDTYYFVERIAKEQYTELVARVKGGN